MKTSELSKHWRAAILLAAGMLALFALAACGGDDNDAPAAGATPTQAPAEPTATSTPAAPTATPMPEPPAVPMIPATAPEPGSDEAQIMAVLEKQVIAVNTADYESFLETCTPNSRKLPTIAQLKYWFEERGGSGGLTPVQFSPQGYNVRNVEVKLLRAPFAQATFHIYDYEQHMGLVTEGDYKSAGIVTQTYEKVDGQWYSEFVPCSGLQRR